jgi:hypothetical protein
MRLDVMIDEEHIASNEDEGKTASVHDDGEKYHESTIQA